MVSQGTGRPGDQPLYDRLWGSGFLPSKYQGVKFRSTGDPVLYLSNPTGFSSDARRRYLDYLGKLNQMKQEESGDPEIATRIAQYEMAYRMQTSVPDLTDLSKEPDRIFEMYGPESRNARHVRRQLPARAAARRTRRPLHSALSPRLGSSQHAAQADHRTVPGHRPARRGAHPGSEAARLAARTRSWCGAASSAAPCTARAS